MTHFDPFSLSYQKNNYYVNICDKISFHLTLIQNCCMNIFNFTQIFNARILSVVRTEPSPVLAKSESIAVTTVLRCVLASLYEGVSVRRSVGPSVPRF